MKSGPRITFAAASGYDVREFELKTQFRCAGSEGFVAWVDNTLQIEPTANEFWTGTEAFDFRIMSSGADVGDALRARAAEGFSARMTTGFCWPWSDARPDGTLVDDVVIGDFSRPWNAKPEARKLAPAFRKHCCGHTIPTVGSAKVT